MKPRYSVSEMFEDFKVLNHHDQAVFFKYMVKQTFSIEEVVNLIMDKGI